MIRTAYMITALFAGAALSSMGFAQQNPAGQQIIQADRTFVSTLSQANRAEIQLGQLAEQKGTSSAVKDFGRRMVQDHQTLENSLSQWAQQNGVQLPQTISQTDQNEINKLQGLSGQSFDRAYIETMLKDHRKDVAEVQRRAERSQDPSVQALAAKTLPTLENHLRLAENIAGELGIPATPGLNK